jgi:RNA polymerase sigma-70 factor (ECF subfamily)
VTAERGRGAPSVARTTARDAEWSCLMARAQDGDGDAYRRLLTDIAPYVRALVARRHRDACDVEDTVQDVLLTVHAIRHTYDPARPFTPWLAAIARRRAIDRLRKSGRTSARNAALREAAETFGDPRANMEETRSDQHALHQAVESLPPGQRQAVTLLKLQEMSLRQASAASGMSIAALKVAMHRALKNLRKRLDGTGGET